MNKNLIAAILAIGLADSSVAQADSLFRDTAVGVVIGAVIGSTADSSDGAVVGGLLGAVVGVSLNEVEDVNTVAYSPPPAYYVTAPVYYQPMPVPVYFQPVDVPVYSREQHHHREHY